MGQDADYTDRDRGGFSQFRKNRFFSGKLMTPRDMETEQEYHAERLHTLNRFVVGSGIVHGLGIRSIVESDDELEVTIGPGLALDGRGRPIVVEQETTKSLPVPSEAEIYLYLRYAEVDVETVPVPNTDGAIDDESTSNRAVEVFEVTYKETPPADGDRIPSVDSAETDPTDPKTVAERLVDRYHERHRSAIESDGDPAVFLGAFERTPDGTWVPADEAPAREFVYDNEFLFAAIVDHITDTENPHQTSVEQPTPDPADGIDEVTDRLNALESELDGLKRDHASLTRYVVRKTLKDRARIFDALADRLADHTGEGSRLAREIAETSRAAVPADHGTDAAYRRHLEDVLTPLIELGDVLEGTTTEESLERYLKSVSELQTAVDDDRSLVELADAQDRVCEAADSLEVLVPVVSDG